MTLKESWLLQRLYVSRDQVSARDWTSCDYIHVIGNSRDLLRVIECT